jgi:tetratricopeptide (TPR) repeat protein
VNLAYIAIRKEDFNRATFILERAISVDRDAILPRYLMAILLLKGGQPREAIGHLRIAARSDVRSIAVYQALGVAFVMLGEAKRAVRSFTSALALAADKQNAVRALSNVLLQNRQFEALSELLKEHLEKAPEDTVSRGLLAQSFLEQRQYPAARRQFLSVLRSIQDKGPDDAERKSLIMNNIGVCYDYEGNWEAAGRSFLKSIEVYPGYDNVAHHNLARLKIRQGRLDQAWRILKSCREGAPENHETPELQALVLEKQRRYEEAIELLVEEIRAGQATEGSYAYASGLLTDVNCDFDSACELAVEGLVRYPFAAILMNNLAYALLMNGQPVEARKILESIPSDAKSSRGDSPVVLAATWGLLYLWEGNIEKGQERYREAEALARTLPQHDLPNIVRQKMHLETARAYARQQDFAAADIEISRGLSVKDGRDLYSQDLTALSNELRNR